MVWFKAFGSPNLLALKYEVQLEINFKPLSPLPKIYNLISKQDWLGIKPWQ
jgi:hypothetical protein